MALHTAPARNGRPGASCTPLRGRGKPQMARVTLLVEACLEGQCFAQEVMSAATAMQLHAAIGERVRLAQEAGRLGVRAQKARDEFRRLAGEIE